MPATGDVFQPQALLYDAQDYSYLLHPHATLTEVRFTDGTVLDEAQLFAMAEAPPTLIAGSDGDDTIIGTDKANILVGGRGDDILRGGAGSDIFFVEGVDQGHDRMVGGAGFDTIGGGEGDDIIGLTAMRLRYSIQLIDGGAGFNTVAGTSGDDHLRFSAMTLLNIAWIDGGAGNDRIIGSQGDDVVLGGAGNDVLRGEAGDDTFVVQGHDQGEDRIRGGDGLDTIVGGVGDDTISLSAFALGYSIERIDGGTGFNILSGTSDDNFLNFSATQLLNISRIDGAGGVDKIRGSQGDDVILGGDGNDVLRGQAGNDTLNGGTADDILVGGAGDDTYVFAAGDGRDKIHNNDTDTSAYDLLRIEIDSYDAIWLSRSGNRLLIDIVGTGDQVQVMNWFGAAEDQLDAIQTNEYMLLRNQVDQLVDAMAAFDAPTGVGAIISQEAQAALESTLAVSWQAVA